MAKAKGGKGVPQKHLHSRLSYLHQASVYLHTASNWQQTKQPSISAKQELQETISQSPGGDKEECTSEHSRHLLTQLRAVSLRSQIRLTPELKHSVCKRCDSLLVAGQTSVHTLENASRRERNPCADVLVITCRFCGCKKRFPVGAKRQKKSGPKLAAQRKEEKMKGE
jgi:ribonuclease P protein subunit RPR2